MATIRVKNPNLGGEKWITIPTKILSEADHIVTNKGQGDLYLSNDGTYKDVIKSANDYTDKLIELITGSSPDILETLKELSNQTSDNKDFINVLNKSIATKLDKTANAVSASKLATPIKLWGNDFDGSLSVYGNLCAPNGNLGLGINANNVVLGNNTNPSYIYGSSVMFKTGTDAVAAYISSDGKIGIGTANPLVGFHVNVNSYFDYPIKVSGTVDHSSPLLKLDATNTNNNGLLVLSKLGNSKAAIGIDDTQGMWFLNLSNSNIFRITSNSLTYGSNKIWHEGNFDPNDYLPLMGGGKIEGDFRSLIIKRNAPYSSSIWYTNTAGQLGGIGVSADKYPIFIDTSDVAHKIWHEGNDGSGSGLDADTLDGYHSNNFMLLHRNQHVFFNDVKTAGSHFMIVNPDDPNVPSVNSGSGNLLVIRGLNADTVTQLFTEYVNNGKTYIRSGTTEESQGGYFGSRPWKIIAFTDSTVNNANKLNNKEPFLYFSYYGWPSDSGVTDANAALLGTYLVNDNVSNTPLSYGYLQSFLTHSAYKGTQLFFGSDGKLYYRYQWLKNDDESIIGDWKQVTTSDGYYKDMRVGLADDLGGIEEKVESEYTIQPTANTSEIRDGYALIESLKGNSIVWNLLFDGVVRSSGSSENVLQNGKYICTPIGTPGTPGSSSWSSGWSNIVRGVFPGKYLVRVTYTRSSKRTDIDDFILSDASVQATYTDTVYKFPIEIGETKQISCIINILSGDDTSAISVSLNDCIVELSDISVINLTKMFGEGNEPETIEEFYARIPQGIDLYAYNEGEIINLTADSIKSVGFNQWDEEYEVGGISSAGTLTNYSDRIRSKNYIPCVPNTWYFAKGHFKHGIFFYDENKKWIENKQVYGQDFQFFTPSNAVYMLWNGAANYFTEGSYCINVFNEDANNTYEPYKEFVRQLPTNLFEGGMKSARTVYDEIYWDKNKKKYVKVTRIGSADLGNLNWNGVDVINGLSRFQAPIDDFIGGEKGKISNILCEKFDTIKGITSMAGDEELGIFGYTNKRIFVLLNESDYSDIATFKTAMQGVILHYELAEPIIEELDIPYMDYEVSNDGTEMIESTTPTTPIKANVVYNFDAINTIKQNRYDVSDLKKGATKLATPVKLWGNDFDGSSDINKSMLFANNLHVFIKDTNDNSCSALTLNHYNILSFGYGTSDKGYTTTVYGTPIRFYTGSDNEHRMVIAENGSVGIGTTNPQYKLDVNGITYSQQFTLPNKGSIVAKMSDNTDAQLMYFGSDNTLIIGTYFPENGISSVIAGRSLFLQTGTERRTSMLINSSGNVTIGNGDMASVYHKLFVDGSVRTGQMYCTGDVVFGANSDGIYIKNSTILMHDSSNAYTTGAVTFTKLGDALFLHDISVINKIESGDLVDWYGVSWSEDSSDPTCTRIGNMALHRSLPIQSAMKGYYIDYSSTEYYNEQIVPLSNDWTKIKYDLRTNNNPVIDTYYLGNTMVKIPEFWYIDDYEPETKTHNLKISQTAKAGWIHHKEAYVGAYEGYSNDIRYRSTKNVTPTVSASRTTLRSLARANGYEDEYKWNIYTYEEHRAICHLFLVEYATRNSQLAVNTALTKDGFKQGGLGSGCTTGAVTINGQTTYSFIPTGTTDSLGNGSGQVAYTVTQTDADGNEIGTVTRYANRYRGIENPFGHIWKHVDDIVNVYNAETTYKTVYKCNKPEHFATNKNAKYKPLCSFPGGSKMQGYSKEIKATINCDFFKYSVGGSGSTYWYDYNYDNDDISEHCLLIGGSSGYGGSAGLFCLSLHDGVGYSSATVGSRLTYLPWAE